MLSAEVQNKKLRVELDLKLKEVECLRKENEELKAQNRDLQENVCFQLSSYTCWYHNASVHVKNQMIVLLQDTLLLHTILSL